MPLNQILPPDPRSDKREHRVVDLDPGERVVTEQQRAEEARRRSDAIRRMANPSEFGSYTYQPHLEIDPVMTEETRRRLEEDARQKQAVQNVVTTHGSVAKVAGAGSPDVSLVPTVNVYTQDDPTEGGAMSAQDRTVRAAGMPIGDTMFDRAETSLRQPEGDEYSSKAATGPTIPRGQVIQSLRDGRTIDVPFEPDQPVSERLEVSAKNAEDAAAAAAELDREEDEELTANAQEAEGRGEFGVAGSRSTDEGSGSPAEQKEGEEPKPAASKATTQRETTTRRTATAKKGGKGK